ncbi:MAG: translocation/assembly module TamB domain-containing protein, partial [Tannerellaceae bacterium]
GDPLDASLNVDALYTLTAYLGDLDERLAQESARLNVPVNCILKIQNKLSDPKLSFDLELPSSSPELERQVQSLITTEDMMSRQIMYLLILSKFYTPDVNTQTGKTSSNFASVASSTISSQLSSILNSITDKVQIGTNIKANDATFDDTEVELMLSSQLLNNRLIFNGNFGYKNNPNIQSFVGDFDLEYKLTKSGEVRLKAYNHYNDMYKYLNSSQTTQGLGIMLKKDFNRPKEIFLTRKKLLLMKKLEQERRKKQAEEEQKQKEQAQETTWIYMKKDDE